VNSLEDKSKKGCINTIQEVLQESGGDDKKQDINDQEKINMMGSQECKMHESSLFL